MNLYEALNINLKKKELISIVGAGGKTTTMLHLAKELKMLGKKVLLTTSTAIYYPEKDDYDKILLLDDRINMIDTKCIKVDPITVIGRKISDDGKLLGLAKETIDLLYKKDIFEYVIVEADGSKRRPIKAPDVHEPVIPKETTKVLGVIGLDSIGESINDKNVHRSEIFSRVTRTSIGERINEKTLYKLIIDKEGLFKDAPGSSERYLILNKVESEIQEEAAASICKLLNGINLNIRGILICSFKYGKILGVKYYAK